MGVVDGRGPAPRLVVSLIVGLPDTSALTAMRRGGMHFLGWGEERDMLSRVYDLLALNTEASGNWKDKPPKLPRWPRPEDRSAPAKKKGALASLYARFAR